MANRQIKFVASFCFLLIVTIHQGLAEMRPAANVILVAATVEGQAATFLIDTGTEHSCLDAGFAARLLRDSKQSVSIRQPGRDGKAESLHVHDFEIESHHLENVAMLSISLSSTYLDAGIAIDGILGVDVLRHFIVTLNFFSGTAHFKIGHLTNVGDKVVMRRKIDGLYFTSVKVQGRSAELLLDTGANFTSISSQMWTRVTTHWRPRAKLEGVRSTGARENAAFVLVPLISVGNISFRDVPIRIQPRSEQGLFSAPDFGGLLGCDILRRFIVTLDLGHNEMYLGSNRNNVVDHNLFSTIGIQFTKAVDNTLTIVAVWTPSPAANAGMKIGDTILAVNQLDARHMSLDDLSQEIHGRPGTQVNLVIESEGRRRDVTLTIRCLLCPQRE